MFRWIRFSLAVLFILTLVFTNLLQVQAARGEPGSADFGFGAVLYPDGPFVEDGAAMASDLGIDWVEIPVSWASVQKKSSASPDFKTLDMVMRLAKKHQLTVLVSLTNAPAWAQTSKGPDPAMTAKFVAVLYSRYPSVIQAVELFPEANTQKGWGGPPNPQGYFNLFKKVNQKMQALKAPVTLVAAGLRPVASKPTTGDINDLAFLKKLYALGAGSIMPVVSIRLDILTGDPMRFPDGSEHRVLRHYEEVRQVMVANQSQKGVIWITRLSPPSGTISTSDSAYQEVRTQTNWINQAYIQLRAQLYVGVTIGQSLNPAPEGMAAEVPGLLTKTGEINSFYSSLSEMISLNRTGSVTIEPGKPKEGNFIKKRP